MTSTARGLETSPIPGFALPADLATPAVVVAADRLDANIARLQRELDGRGVRLRPHVKTHKSLEIGRRQVAAGAAGLTVGTLGEAEVFAAGGFGDLFLAYPLWADGDRARRVRAIHDEVELRVGVESTAAAERLGRALAGAKRPGRVLVEVDSGGRRTGVRGSDEAVRVARAARDAGLRVEGAFTHGGHSYRPGGAEDAAADEVRVLEAVADALAADGFEVATISAGSTPTMLGSARGRVTEIRAGTYVLGDRQQWAIGAVPGEGVALAVAATVVAASADGFVVDAGAKALTKDRADWLAGFGHLPAWPDAIVERLYDYHGVVRLAEGSRRPALGERVAIVPNHVCPVVDLFDELAFQAAGGSLQRWPVDARGRSG